MPFPRKFQKLLDIELGDVPAPDYVWLVYAVCALTEVACGWGGWIIEAAFQGPDDGSGTYPSGTGDKVLPAGDQQTCPCCGRDLFRTAAKMRMVPSEKQTFPLHPGVDYEIVPMSYKD